MTKLSHFSTFFLATLVGEAQAHGVITSPPTWFMTQEYIASHGGSMYPGDSCSPSCTGKSAPGQLERAQGCACEWYTNFTSLNTNEPGAWSRPDPNNLFGKPTIPRNSPLRTYQDWNFNAPDGQATPGHPQTDWSATHPWRAPGTAPIHSPCGVDGGNPNGCSADPDCGDPDRPNCGNPKGDNCAGGGYGHGPDARNFSFPNFVTTDWVAGDIVEVAWALTANHGGGYSYRLCKTPAEGRVGLTEECFQRTTLDFVGDTQWAQFSNDRKNRTAFKGIRTTIGTFPKGSMWMRNPIPACAGPGGPNAADRGGLDTPGLKGGSPQECGAAAFSKGSWPKAHGTQFPPPFPTGKGFGNNEVGGLQMMFSIVDKVQLPQDLTPGDWTLSLRWDCEQTTQVWNSCSAIRIHKP